MELLKLSKCFFVLGLAFPLSINAAAAPNDLIIYSCPKISDIPNQFYSYDVFQGWTLKAIRENGSDYEPRHGQLILDKENCWDYKPVKTYLPVLVCETKIKMHTASEPWGLRELRIMRGVDPGYASCEVFNYPGVIMGFVCRKS